MKRRARILIKRCNLMKWKILSTSYPFRCKWLTVRKDHIIMPSGHEIDDFYVIEHPMFVNVIAITTDGLFLLEEQYRHGIQRVCYELCAGSCECNEPPVETAKRELLEETGFGEGEWFAYYHSASNSSSMNCMCCTFIARGVRKVQEQSLESSEDIKIHLLTKKELIDVLNKELIYEGVHQAPLWKYLYENE